MNKVSDGVNPAVLLLEQKKKLLYELKERRKAQSDFIAFCKRVFPGYEVGKHHKYIGKILMKALRREAGWTRLVIHEPPQHGKSLQCSVLFPAFYMGRFPDDPVILTAYNDVHALTLSKKCRNIVASEWYHQVFPDRELAKDSYAAHSWHFANHKGGLSAAGIGGGLTGKGAKLLIIDDPIKNRREVENQAFREKQKEDYLSTIKTRLHDDAIQIVPMTRWHEDDIANFLIKEQGFRYVRLPAIAEADDPLGREEGEALWESKFPLSFLLETKETSGSYNWNSMYQGLPSSPEGLLFKREHFKIIDKAPKGLNWFRAWDLAASESESADYTASFRVAQDSNGNVYIDGGIRVKFDWAKVRKLIKQTSIKERFDTMVGIEAQGIQKGMVQECWADPELVSVGILGIPVPSSKRIRAMPVMARAEAGKLYLVKGAWNEAFIEEFVHFDVGEHDDQVDAVSLAFHMLALSSPTVVDLNDYEVSDARQQYAGDDYFSVVDDDFREEKVYSHTFTF